jgi:hypothetical protein
MGRTMRRSRAARQVDSTPLAVVRRHKADGQVMSRVLVTGRKAAETIRDKMAAKDPDTTTVTIERR